MGICACTLMYHLVGQHLQLFQATLYVNMCDMSHHFTSSKYDFHISITNILVYPNQFDSYLILQNYVS